MKTTDQATKKRTSRQTPGLLSRPEQLNTENSENQKQQEPRIDFARRHANRQLATEQVVALLRTEAPGFYTLAEIVGKWVWIQFADKQPPQVTRVLAELGFHWNNRRQLWQHPCGPVDVEASTTDPRTKYGSSRPALA